MAAHGDTIDLLRRLLLLNYYSASDPSPFGLPKLTIGFQHLWSLSFKEQFYVFWPWITRIVSSTIRTRLRNGGRHPPVPDRGRSPSIGSLVPRHSPVGGKTPIRTDTLETRSVGSSGGAPLESAARSPNEVSDLLHSLHRCTCSSWVACSSPPSTAHSYFGGDSSVLMCLCSNPSGHLGRPMDRASRVRVQP